MFHPVSDERKLERKKYQRNERRLNCARTTMDRDHRSSSSLNSKTILRDK